MEKSGPLWRFSLHVYHLREMRMNSIPLMFSTVTGLFLTAVGAALASSEIAGWGLFTVGLGILTVAFVSRATASPRLISLNLNNTDGAARLQQR